MGGFDGLPGMSGGAAGCPPVLFLVWAAFAVGLGSVFIKHQIKRGKKAAPIPPQNKTQNLLPRARLL